MQYFSMSKCGLSSHSKTSFPRELFKAMSCSFLTPLVGPFNPSLSSLAWKRLLCIRPQTGMGPGPRGDVIIFLPQSSFLTPHPVTAETSPDTQPLVLCWAGLRLLKRRFQPLLPLAVLCLSVIANRIPQAGNWHLSCKLAESGPQTQVQHLLDLAASFWTLSSS